jgi:hypothetical protein
MTLLTPGGHHQSALKLSSQPPPKPLLVRDSENVPVAASEITTANGPVNLDPMLTTRQAAAFIGVEAETLKKWRQRDGKGPVFIRLPTGTIRYRLSSLLKFIADSTVEP